MVEKYLSQIYYNPESPASFGGVDSIYRVVKDEGKHKISRNKIRLWLQKQDMYTLHKPVRYRFKRNRVVVGAIDEQWEADLVIMDSISKYNNGFKYILTVIDVLSKYAWAEPIKTKTGENLVKASEKILKKGRKPETFHSDKGTEFMNRKFQAFLKKHNIRFFTTQNETKASIVERCNKYGEYPIGHPEIITENFQPISDYFGLVKCSVLPPRALYHPVLPYHTQGKLMFPLCRTCADNLQQEPCHHSDAERTLHGTWVTLELEKALGKGYELMRVDEVWHFPEHTDGLFKDYIDTFLKIKQEASGFPPECDTDEKKGKYIADYAAKEGIQLDPRQIVKNPGKFAQRPNMTKVKIISDPAEYFDLLSSDQINVTDANFINDELIEVHFENVDEFVESDGKTNVVIAAFTTAHARLKLYGVLEQLNRRVLYFDTDSVIYVSKEDEWEPPTGSYIGQLTDELDGGYITTFVSGGPKNYAYETSTDKTVCKVRGITLNYRTQQHVNFDVMSGMVRGEGPEKVTVNIPYKINRNTKEKSGKTRSENKDYRIVYNKRVIVNNFDTLPYGF
ncbi:DNA polymerase [Paramuricea clavata]|uniref:DNA-directed DNA polymerase n=1 Tax=Paramuricea clavata TaxID=317549 RepID=A0A6S7IE47_PARCT|nr:DNA polymerase [Paramuricea clavata]